MLTTAVTPDLVSILAELPCGRHELRLTAPGGAIDALLFKAEEAQGLVVVFHGAVDREKRQLPVLIELQPLQHRAHILAIADPSLSQGDELKLAWYQGHEGFDTPELVRKTVMFVRAGLRVGKTIYFGTSGGGFAALAASHADPYSIVVAGNPQSTLRNYSPELLEEYMRQCWPKAHMAGMDPSDVVTVDVGEKLYRQGHNNFVIYVQSSGDRVHFERQMLPFLSAMKGTPNKRRFILHSSFWGTLGHVVATEEYLRWIEAVLDSDQVNYESILANWHRRSENSPESKKSSKTAGAESAAKVHRPADIDLATRLATWAGLRAKPDTEETL